MNKKTKIILVCLFATFILVTLAGCNNLFGGGDLNPNTIGVTHINLVESKIYLCPPNESIPSYRPNYTTYELEISIAPENATNKNVNIFLENSEDSEFLGVTTDGKLTARKSKGFFDNEGNFTAQPVIVIIRSVSNPTVAKRVEVYVEETAITGFRFVPSSKNFIIGDAPWQLIPEFIPRHAVLGIDNLRFSSVNEEFATVDSTDGTITPSESNVGRATIEVTTTAGGVEIQGIFDVFVKYEPPNWRLSVDAPQGVNEADFFSQIVNYIEPINFFIETNQERMDEHPEITWKVDGSRVPGQTGRIFVYEPDDIMRGTHKVKVEIVDANSQIQIIESANIEIYEELSPNEVTLQLTYLEPVYSKDRIYVNAMIENNYYPPLSIDWYLYDVETGQTEPCLGTSPSTDNYAFSFNIPKAGRFKIEAKCLVKLNSTLGTITVNKFSDEIIEVEELEEGNDIQNVYIEGINHGSLSSPQYLPFVGWDAPPLGGETTVEITRAGGTPVRISSTDPNYKVFFYYNGFAVPNTIATLAQTFSVRVKGEAYGFTESVTYQGNSIKTAEYKFLNIIDSTLNITSYFSDLRKLGKIINYMHVFRPASFAVPPSGSETRTGYKINLYTPLQYDNLDEDVYPAGFPSDYGSKPYADDQLNVFRLISAANYAYGESGKYAFTYGVKADGSFDATFYFDPLDAIDKKTEQNREEYPIIPHYTSTPRAEGYNGFSTQREGVSISVSTTNQLYLAVSWGLKPQPVAGSPAYEVYEEAKSVLRRIIDNSMNEAEKVHAIYDYLSCEVLYDKQLLEYSKLPEGSRPQGFYRYEGFYMEGVFLSGSAVCDGIAKSFVLLTYMEGIQSVKVSGVSQEVGHAWNYALVDGKWYGVDATWASVSHNNVKELATHRHLLVTDTELEVDHTKYGEYPPTEEEGLGFYEYYDKVVANTPDFDHHINSTSEFQALFAHYTNLVAEDTEITELYIEITFDFQITTVSVQQFFNNASVGAFDWLVLADLQVVFVHIE